ncbi:heme A synthase [Rhodococcus qingshengii]|uniref:COX15/CtaA family protein n=1 Tax=Rhodococcus qingshengii TaxID=334542 RepID=UPI0036D94480
METQTSSRRTTPLDLLARRYTLSPRSLRWASTAALVMSILIVLGGGVVRVTGSGLGCPDWPTCADGSVAPTAAMGIHGIIEFTNRMLTWVLTGAVGWVIIAARLQKPRDPRVLKWAWAQFWVVVLNAVVGGVSVLTDLNPYVVAGHFLAAVLLLTAAVVTRELVHSADTVPQRSVTNLRLPQLVKVFAAANTVLLVVGTVVTGSGPHAGDSSDVHRMPVNWVGVTVVHALAAVFTLMLALKLYRTLGVEGLGRERKMVATYVGVFVGQGLIGGVQSLTNLPESLVVLHVFGSALVWVGAVRAVQAVNAICRTRTDNLNV